MLYGDVVRSVPLVDFPSLVEVAATTKDSYLGVEKGASVDGHSLKIVDDCVAAEADFVVDA